MDKKETAKQVHGLLIFLQKQDVHAVQTQDMDLFLVLCSLETMAEIAWRQLIKGS